MSQHKNHPFTVDTFNRMVESLRADQTHHQEIKKDWRSFISANFSLTETQRAFFEKLPPDSVKTVQKIFTSMIHDGGKIYLQQDAETKDIDVVCENIVALKNELLKTIVVCRFDGFFYHCKWFPKK